MNKEISQKIKIIRIFMNIKQKDLANALNIRSSLLSLYERVGFLIERGGK